MEFFDLAVAYKWIYDQDFVAKIEQIFQLNGFTTYIVHKDNIDLVTDLLKSNQISFKAYLDRASDEDENFEEIAQLIKQTDTYIFNHYDKVESAIDKSIIHQKLVNVGLQLPNTIIIPPLDEAKDISLTNDDLAKIGIPFIIKPAYYSGGGEGINLNGKTIDDINKLRKEFSDDRYLVQERIVAKMNGNNRCWFRSFWFMDEAFPLWWDDRTHIYRHISPEEYEKFSVSRVKDILAKIANISGMDYFSTEIALTENDELFVIDYVNDQCDMRFKSKYFNGVPDDIVEIFIKKMMAKVESL